MEEGSGPAWTKAASPLLVGTAVKLLGPPNLDALLLSVVPSPTLWRRAERLGTVEKGGRGFAARWRTVVGAAARESKGQPSWFWFGRDGDLDPEITGSLPCLLHVRRICWD